MIKFIGFGKICFRILVLFLTICWITMAIFTAVFFVNRTYIYPLRYKDLVVEYSEGYGLEKALIFAVIKTESSFDSKATSKAGAKGLMQITEGTGEFISGKLGIEEYDLYDERTNINFGCYYVKYLLAKFKYMETAMTAYNAGEGNVSIWLMDKRYSEDGKRLKRVPYRESEEYIKRINKNFRKYKKLYRKFLDKSDRIV